MFYFEVIASDRSTASQRETTTQLGPFLVEAVDDTTARMLVGLNYDIGVGRGHSQGAPPLLWSDPTASDVTRLSIEPGTIQPRQAFEGAFDRASDYIAHAELKFEGRVVARMIWWPCGVHDVYPFGDPMFLGEREPSLSKADLSPVG